MEIPVLILGESGSGKSTSIENFDIDEVGIFNVASKVLPFRKKFNKMNNVKHGHIINALNFRNLIHFIITGTPDDVIVYFLHHTEETENGKIKAKTSGKMLDTQLTLEGLFSIALLCEVDGDKHKFITQSDGYTTCKSPREMFDREIPNDLKFVDNTIREYYELGE